MARYRAPHEGGTGRPAQRRAETSVGACTREGLTAVNLSGTRERLGSARKRRPRTRRGREPRCERAGEARDSLRLSRRSDRMSRRGARGAASCWSGRSRADRSSLPAAGDRRLRLAGAQRREAGSDLDLLVVLLKAKGKITWIRPGLALDKHSPSSGSQRAQNRSAREIGGKCATPSRRADAHGPRASGSLMALCA